jgi:hypothetical protein
MTVAQPRKLSRPSSRSGSQARAEAAWRVREPISAVTPSGLILK